MFSNIIVGVDGEPGGRDAIALAQRLAGPSGRVTFGQVHAEGQEPPRPPDLEPEAEVVSIVAPSPVDGLHRIVEERDADLLVIGSHNRGLGGRVMVHDDTADALGGAGCPVAVAPWGYARWSKPIEVIGVGYDASPDGEHALAVARKLAAGFGAELRAMTVVDVPDPFAHPQPTTREIPPDAELIAAQQRLDALEGVAGRALYGVPAEELEVFGDDLDLLVVGSRGLGQVKRLIFGSTTRQLVRVARCPLLVLQHVDAPPESPASAPESLPAA